MKLTPYQIKVLGMMEDGWYIAVHYNFSANTRDITLSNGGDCLALRSNTFESLVKKRLIFGKSVYSTVQPDTESFEYRLKNDNN